MRDTRSIFIKCFERAKYLMSIDTDNSALTNKELLNLYNQRYHDNISESSLSKYLSGINKIPADVLINMCDFAQMQDYLSLDYSRLESFAILPPISESLAFIKDEIDSICNNYMHDKNCANILTTLNDSLSTICYYASGYDTDCSAVKDACLKLIEATTNALDYVQGLNAHAGICIVPNSLSLPDTTHHYLELEQSLESLYLHLQDFLGEFYRLDDHFRSLFGSNHF